MRNRLRLVSRYRDNHSLRLSFNRLAQKTFGIDFEGWYQKGAWDDSYACYSFADGEEIVANVSVTAMTMLLDGSTLPALQVGTVMTHPGYRGQGLFSTLMGEALASHGEQEGGFTFLFANASVADLYPKLGFRRRPFYRIEADVEIGGQAVAPRLRKLDVNRAEDWALIVRLARERAPLSGKCSAPGSASIFLWYCLNIFPHALYYAEDRELLLVYEWSGEKIQLMDAVSPRPLLMRDIAECLAAARPGEEAANNGRWPVEFHFTPDFADLASEEIRWREDEEEFFFVREECARMPPGYVIPLSART
ncbi:GNAT family N-acetyltransferase [Paenibacillus sp. YN15]|uniref:GNAT family N-acetyltransferase n=1 Tax=Paenibacillus sp. YN15 TaxID=1742774 RepID=UPI0015EC86EC|nr:GNAT family N-acetyltransferase [Paenibacillus sp. YN15]